MEKNIRSILLNVAYQGLNIGCCLCLYPEKPTNHFSYSSRLKKTNIFKGIPVFYVRTL